MGNQSKKIYLNRYAGYTLAKSPEVVVNRIGPKQPWNNIKQHENPKVISLIAQLFCFYIKGNQLILILMLIVAHYQ